MIDSIEKKAFYSVIKKTSHGAKKPTKNSAAKMIHSIGTEKKYIGCVKGFFIWSKENVSTIENFMRCVEDTIFLKIFHASLLSILVGPAARTDCATTLPSSDFCFYKDQDLLMIFLCE